MPKPYTFPLIFDSVAQLEISHLKKIDLLKPNQIASTVISWRSSATKETTASIRIKASWQNEHTPFITLSYLKDSKSIEYNINIELITSNLGKGLIPYFICPFTLSRCRKLYLIDGIFLHREAYKQGLYDSQTISKNMRELIPYFKTEELYEQLYKKNFKTSYAGKPTKRYLRLIKQLEKANSISHEKILLAMIY